MGDLAKDQARFIAVLQHGPSAFPDGVFAGEPDWVLLGLKAHANTISHARLVALEHTFPRTRERMGHDAFNALSRVFVDLPDVRSRKLMHIGAGFAEFLADHGADAAQCDLAAVEWAWLHSYHAAEAPALDLSDLAGLDEEGLLDLKLAMHPATRLVAVQTDIAVMLPELAGSAPGDARHLLITRPDAEVLLHPLDALQAALARCAQKPVTMRNLLAVAIETAKEAEALPAIFALIGAGMLARPGG
ncbi:putative DNA-binding domain-containing protein [Blastomonas sp. AAP53]|uniref:HvfC/BufC family peptide modification chaperone n=1 Tax=Blastomonas sp. AAP53 TaxID=1248760 RepID=UPI00037A8B27|nr:putative DNA-binding domain-containing protein [Blastomonas sp. AAP53]